MDRQLSNVPSLGEVEAVEHVKRRTLTPRLRDTEFESVTVRLPKSQVESLTEIAVAFHEWKNSEA